MQGSVGRLFRVLTLLVLSTLSLAVIPAFAQGDAAVIGQVTDESGAVLPGVTITATSPALQVQSVTAITNERGEYRMTPLPIGTYVVVYELSGFQAVRREGVRLTAGFVAKVDVALKVGAMAETITVSGASPVVDVTSTAASTQLTRETLEAIPTGRNGVISLAAQTPGVRANLDVGGTAMVTNPTFRAFGQSGEFWHTLDGITMTILEGSDIGGSDYVDYAAMEEARIDTVAKDAEMPRPGIQIIEIVKSGSNDFHGSGFWGQTRPWLQGSNLDAKLQAQQVTGQNKVTNRFDVSGELGGRVVMDKLWFYEGTRGRGIDEQLPGIFQADGSQGIHLQRQYFSTTKVSYQPTSSQRIIGLFQFQKKHDDGQNLTTLIAYESRTDQVFYNYPWKVEYQATHGSSMTTSLQYGDFPSRSPWAGHSALPPMQDIATQKLSGLNTNAGSRYRRWLRNPKGSLGWYKPGVALGDHELKVGFDYVDIVNSGGYVNLPYVNMDSSVVAPGNYRLIFNNGAPFQIQTYNRPVNTPKSVVHFLGIYGKDSLTVHRKLTLNLGLRFDHDAGFAPVQCQEAGQFVAAQCFPRVNMKVWNTLSPRLHAAYDLRGNGKTVIKGGYGRYQHIRTTGPEVTAVNRNVLQTTTWLWHDDGDKAYDVGEVNLNPSGTDFVSVAGGTNSIPNPNEKEPHTDEISASIERELIPSFAVRLTGIYSRNSSSYMNEGTDRPFSTYSIPITRPDPGVDNRVGTPDDPNVNITYYEYPTSLRGLAFSTTQLVNPAGSAQTYKSFELASNKRLTQHWAFMASYSATKKHVPLGVATTILSYDPNTIFNLADDTWEWTAKASGTYMFPWGIVASGNWELRSGNKYARQVLFTGGVTIPSQVMTVEPIGTRTQPNLSLMDVRVEKRFNLDRSRQLLVRLNVFNVPNANTAVTVNQRSGAQFGFPTVILQPRIGEFNIQYKF